MLTAMVDPGPTPRTPKTLLDVPDAVVCLIYKHLKGAMPDDNILFPHRQQFALAHTCRHLR